MTTLARCGVPGPRRTFLTHGATQSGSAEICRDRSLVGQTRNCALVLYGSNDDHMTPTLSVSVGSFALPPISCSDNTYTRPDTRTRKVAAYRLPVLPLQVPSPTPLPHCQESQHTRTRPSLSDLSQGLDDKRATSKGAFKLKCAQPQSQTP